MNQKSGELIIATELGQLQITRLYFLTFFYRLSTFVENPLQIHYFLCKTNPICWMPKMNLTSVKTNHYENLCPRYHPSSHPQNKPNSNPICWMPKMNVTSVLTNHYENLCPRYQRKSDFDPSSRMSQKKSFPAEHNNRLPTEQFSVKLPPNGALAQLGERLHGMQEVVSSNLIGSIFSSYCN